MSNGPRRRPPKSVQKDRPAGELKFTAVIAPPDGARDDQDQPIRVQLEVDLRAFTLAERQLAKRAMSKFVAPIDMEDVVVVHAWVVWRRTHPESSLQYWMDHITFGDVLDGLAVEPGRVEWDTTPEGYDPNR